MAAAPDAPTVELADLWQSTAEDLAELLEEETGVWQQQLEWDFRASADLVRRFVSVHALSGHVMTAGSRVVGYSYFVCEEHKGLIGDFYIRSGYRTPDNESMLLTAMVDRLARARQVRRIESQLMLAPMLRRPLPAARYGRCYPRNFMVADSAAVKKLPSRPTDGITFERWSERRQEDVAGLIAAAYRNHIDSEINDQYRSSAGARRFLFNIVQYPGCGVFSNRGSWLAVVRETGRVCGASLTSMVSPGVGHVTQICLAPSARGQGLGYELLRRSMSALAQDGARRVSLTVTAANENAVQLYLNVGYRIVRQFPALVWDGFQR